MYSLRAPVDFKKCDNHAGSDVSEAGSASKKNRKRKSVREFPTYYDVASPPPPPQLTLSQTNGERDDESEDEQVERMYSTSSEENSASASEANFTSPQEKSAVASEANSKFKEMLADKRFYDAVLIASDGTEIPTYRCLLAYYFKKGIILEDYEEIPFRFKVGDFSVEVIQAVVVYMLDEMGEINGKGIELLKFATTYDITKLIVSFLNLQTYKIDIFWPIVLLLP